ncbi:MAG TPA: LysM domain-containing protein [Terriglobales bacterium]
MDDLQRIERASNWLEYYNAYKLVYEDLFERRWALGRATFANQLHHTAIPDVSGSAFGSINWAAYSQPSAETLVAFFPVFRQLLNAEPHRIRSNRYLFFVPHGNPVDPVNAKAALGELAGRVDFWCASLSQALAVPQQYGPVAGLDALLARDKSLLHGVDFSDAKVSPFRFCETLRGLVVERLALDNSVVPPSIRLPFVDSSFLLTAFLNRLDVNEAVRLVGDYAGIAAWLAVERAREARWESGSLDYFQEVVKASPPKTRTHVVKPGEFLSTIVRREYQMSYESLWPLIRALNPSLKDPNRILAGQQIKLPVLPAG